MVRVVAGVMWLSILGAVVASLPASTASDITAQAFDALGTADAPFGLVPVQFDARLAWDGSSGWSIEFRDPDSGTLLHQNSFTGTADAYDVQFIGACFMHSHYAARSELAPDLFLTAEIHEQRNLCLGTRVVDVFGSYLGFFIAVHA